MSAVSARQLRETISSLSAEMEEPLNRALAYTGALDLMGFGLRGIHHDYGPSVVALAETIITELEGVRNAWCKIIEVTKDDARARRQTVGKAVSGRAIKVRRQKGRAPK